MELCNKAGETPEFLFTQGVQRGEALVWGKERAVALSRGKAPLTISAVVIMSYTTKPG